jgi:hypothetical protein
MTPGRLSDEQIACTHDEVGLPRVYRDAMNFLANYACPLQDVVKFRDD